MMRGAFEAIREPGVELPTHPHTGRLNAHITVMHPADIEQLGGAHKITERGHEFTYTLGELKTIVPKMPGISRVWFVEVKSPALEKLRKSYGLSATPRNGEYKFHVTVAQRRIHILGSNEVAKSTRPEQQLAGQTMDAAGAGSRTFKVAEFFSHTMEEDAASLFITKTAGDGDYLEVRDDDVLHLFQKTGADFSRTTGAGRTIVGNPLAKWLPSVFPSTQGPSLELRTHGGPLVLSLWDHPSQIAAVKKGWPGASADDHSPLTPGRVGYAIPEYGMSSSNLEIPGIMPVKQWDTADLRRAGFTGHATMPHAPAPPKEIYSYACNEGGCGLSPAMPMSYGAMTPELYEKHYGPQVEKVVMTPPGYLGSPAAGVTNAAVPVHNALSRLGSKITGKRPSEYSPLHTYVKEDGKWVDKGAYEPQLDQFVKKYKWPLIAAAAAALGYGGYKLHNWMRSAEKEEDPNTPMPAKQGTDHVRTDHASRTHVTAIRTNGSQGAVGLPIASTAGKSAAVQPTPGGGGPLGFGFSSRQSLADYSNANENGTKTGTGGGLYAPATDGSPYSSEHASDDGVLRKVAVDGVPLTLRQTIAQAVRKVREPKSEAQAEAGNYRMGHVSMHGLGISIETPAGKSRKPGWKPLQNAYGYIKRTLGRDGDHVDIFLGPAPDTELVFVVDQINPDNKRFDEHKCMLGFKSKKEAKEAYLANYEPNWQGLGAITPLTIQQFKAWLKDGDQTKRVAKQVFTLKTADDREQDVLILSTAGYDQLIAT